MKVNDRGTMKWTSLMLPEHVEALRVIWDDQDQKTMPDLDDQQIAENNMKLQLALEYDKKIKIKYYEKNDHVNVEGYLLGTDMVNGVILPEEKEIMFNRIIEVNFI